MKDVLRRELGSDKPWERMKTVGYEAEDPSTRKLRTLESSLENLLLAQPETLLADGSQLTVTGAIIRYVGLIISFVCLFIGVIWVAFDANRQGWHDTIAGTYVVKASRGRSRRTPARWSPRSA